MQGQIISGERRLGQAELAGRAARAASGFTALGFGEDSAVAIMLRNDFAFFEAAMGAALIGAYAVPINWHFKDDETGNIIRRCSARALIIHADLLPGIAAAACAVPAGATAWAERLDGRQP